MPTSQEAHTQSTVPDHPEHPGGLFDENYYRLGFGNVPYSRTEPKWTQFFGMVADQLTRALRPRTVLDAGCALGLLVEAFWDRGVQAKGIDISPYAIANVRRDMVPHCVVGSIADGIPGRYDLITCIEVLEHMPPEQSRDAIRHMTSATDVILFSSTPFDLDEPTHVNVKPILSWLQEFQEHGFSPVLDFDPSFVAQHAMLLRRREEPYSVEVLNTFASVLRLRHHAVQLSGEAASLRNELTEQRSRVQESESRNQAVEQQLADSRRQVDELRSLNELQRSLNEATGALMHVADMHKDVAAEIRAVATNLNRTTDLDTAARIEALENTVETICRPVAELFPIERLEELEKRLYNVSNYPALDGAGAPPLDARIKTAEDQLNAVDLRASEALHLAHTILNSRIWRMLVSSGGVLLRVTGRRT
jgi:SAM-dependent methyltransferase